MSCSSPDLLLLAETIANGSSCDEVSARCAISRAYYSALHLVKDTFPPTERNSRQPGESSHVVIIREAQLYGKFANAGRQEAALVAKLMSGLRRDRNNADYQLNLEIDQGNALDAVARVKQVVAHCSYIEARRTAVKESLTK